MELPEHVPYDVIKKYILTFTSLWGIPTYSCFDDIFASTSEFMKKLITEHFGQFKNLEKHVSSITQAELEKFESQTMKTLTKQLELDAVPLYTQNTEHWSSERKSWIQQYRNVQYPHPQVSDLSPDVENALGVMGTVRTYFQVAYKRIIDYVPLTIEHELNQALANALQRSLFESFSAEGDATNRMKALLTEDPVVAKKREFLEERQTRLLRIKQRLDTFGQESSN